MKTPPVFDGHNDVLSRLYKRGTSGGIRGFLTGDDGHIDVPKSRLGGFAGGFFAVFVPSRGEFSGYLERMQAPEYDLPLPPEVPLAEAQKIAWKQVETLRQLEKDGGLTICTDTDAILHCISSGEIAAVLHMEGAEAIDPGFETLDRLYEAGLRSLGPVWSRPTPYGDGVPFRFPSNPDIGGGLTDIGKSLVRKCNRMGILVDTSHISETGFWDIAAITDAPIVATHSNVHAICPHSRNLTDKQLAAIAETGGVVGLNFATALLREDGRMVDDVPVSMMVRHLEHMVRIVGEDGVALGSDFDGATVPKPIGDASGLGALRQAMTDAGFGTKLIEKICYKNWVGVLKRTWRQ
ncbi:dipeptidase [Aestuariibius sp. 2305UL40-4]|uniref:dipeptidase n=1 Tax=Aestuariibius violaceus TaxID=3234132 RepID=UPI00345E278B